MLNNCDRVDQLFCLLIHQFHLFNTHTCFFPGSLKVTQDDGEKVWIKCSLCGLAMSEKYKWNRKKDKSWPHPSWPKTRQHIKCFNHFKRYIHQDGGELEPDFMESVDGKHKEELDLLLEDEFKERIGGTTRWANKRQNEGARSRDKASDKPTRNPEGTATTRPSPAMAKAKEAAAELVARLNDPLSGLAGWVGRNTGVLNPEVPKKSV